MSTTATSGHTLSDLLRRAAQAYEEGDLESAGKLEAAADSIAGGSGAGGDGGAAESCPGAGAADDAGAMGQMLGQVGQQVGQLASSVAQPLQGLSQLPQQVMQGVQQVSGALGGTGAGDAATKTAAVGSDQDAAPDQPDEDHAEDRREQPEPERSEPVRHVEAAPGDSDIRGRAPAAESAEPAQTRPQQSPP